MDMKFFKMVILVIIFLFKKNVVIMGWYIWEFIFEKFCFFFGCLNVILMRSGIKSILVGVVVSESF